MDFLNFKNIFWSAVDNLIFIHFIVLILDIVILNYNIIFHINFCCYIVNL